jgi:hypothetical protein
MPEPSPTRELRMPVSKLRNYKAHKMQNGGAAGGGTAQSSKFIYVSR